MIGPQDVPIEDKTVTIVYGTDMVNVEIVNFVCASREFAAVCIDTIHRFFPKTFLLFVMCT